jgi:glycosyltransferase involved in cell wall biosynthesis
MGVPRDKITVMHNPIDVVTKKVRPAVIAGVGKEAFVLFYAGRVAKDKNLAQVVRALSAAPSNVMLVVAGEGEDIPALKQLAASRGVGSRVVFVGKIPNEQIWPYYARCDAIVLPSRFLEPFSRMAIEGMAMGKPAILSDRGGNAETGVDGVSAFHVPPDNDERMARRIAQLTTDKALRHKIGKAGQAWVRKELSVAGQGKRFVAIYKTIIKGRSL